MKKIAFLLIAAALWPALGCASQAQTIAGTSVADSKPNRDVIEVVEEYRMAVERKDTAALLLMASENYWEDGGTPSGGDDYGHAGLREVLNTRFDRASDIRYALRYMDVQRRCRPEGDPETNRGCRAYVNVLIDASFTMVDANGQIIRQDMQDQNQLVLEWDEEGRRWQFVAGM